MARNVGDSETAKKVNIGTDGSEPRSGVRRGTSGAPFDERWSVGINTNLSLGSNDDVINEIANDDNRARDGHD